MINISSFKYIAFAILRCDESYKQTDEKYLWDSNNIPCYYGTLAQAITPCCYGKENITSLP